MHGCEGNRQPDGKLKFHHGTNTFSYDGNDFLSYDFANEVWIAATDAALPTKRKWNDVRVLAEYVKGYLEWECMDWLSKFMEYGQEQLRLAGMYDWRSFL